MSAINNFLLAFNHGTNHLETCLEFGADVEAATAAYAELEAKYRNCHSVDIVLVGSDSLDTVRVTHSNYFANGARDLVSEALSVRAR